MSSCLTSRQQSSVSSNQWMKKEFAMIGVTQAILYPSNSGKVQKIIEVGFHKFKRSINLIFELMMEWF